MMMVNGGSSGCWIGEPRNNAVSGKWQLLKPS